MKFITQSADFTSKRQNDILSYMSKYESRKSHEGAQELRKLAQDLVNANFTWGRDELKGITSQTALAVIVQVACEQGSISVLGNLEETLVQISRATAPDADLSKFEEYYGITDKPESEEVLSALDKLTTSQVSLSSKLAEAYLQNLELQCVAEIKFCEQDSVCINNILAIATKRAVSAGVDGKKINNLKKQIEAWAYQPEAEAA